VERARCEGSILSLADRCPSRPPSPSSGRETSAEQQTGKIETESETKWKSGIPGNGGPEQQSPESSCLLTTVGAGDTTSEPNRRSTRTTPRFLSWLTGLVRRRGPRDGTTATDDDEVRRVIVSSSSDFSGSALRSGALNRDETTMTFASVDPPSLPPLACSKPSSTGPGPPHYNHFL